MRSDRVRELRLLRHFTEFGTFILVLGTIFTIIIGYRGFDYINISQFF